MRKFICVILSLVLILASFATCFAMFVPADGSQNTQGDGAGPQILGNEDSDAKQEEPKEQEEPKDPNTIYSTPCEIKDEGSGICFTIEEYAFPVGTRIDVKFVGIVRLNEDDELDCIITPPSVVHDSIKDESVEYNVYSIQATYAGQEIQPLKPVKVVFPFIDKATRNIAVYYVTDTGAKENLPLTISTSERTATTTLNHFSWYVVANLDKDNAVAAMPVQPAVLYTIIVILGLSTIGFAAWAIFKRPKQTYNL